MVEIEMAKKVELHFLLFDSLWKTGGGGGMKLEKKYCDKIGSCLKTKEYQRL